MPEKIPMIALSPTMETGTIARWRKKEGDKVASGDVLCEVETDKATMDYESTAEGTLLKILLPEGGQAKVGDVIAIVGKPGEDISGIVAGLGPGSSADHASARTPAQAAHAQAPAAAPAAVSAQPQAARAAPASGRIKSSPL
ncbi:MAG: biotin/lipoyl-containing protein, partial [Spirochaetia bacterium]